MPRRSRNSLAAAAMSMLFVSCADSGSGGAGGSGGNASESTTGAGASGGATGTGTGGGGGGAPPAPVNCDTVVCHYVRAADDVDFDGDGSSWAAADSEGGVGARRGLPDDLARGELYFIADGLYGDHVLDDLESETETITIKKATEVDHGSAEGWQTDLGDGAAVWGLVAFARDYYVFDGSFRNEQAWDQEDSYGFRLSYVLDWPLNFPPGGDHITVRYCDIGQDYSEFYVSGGYPSGVYLVKNDDVPGVLTGLAVSHCHVHNVQVHVYLLGVEDVVIERTYFGPGWGKEAIRGVGEVQNVSIRHNVFRDSSQEDPEEVGTGSTAPIAIWGSDDNYRDIRVYGNVFWDTIPEPHSGGVIVIGGDGVGWVGAPAFDCRVHNNTIVGMRNYQAQIAINGGTGNRAYNNLWHDFGDAFTGAHGEGLSEGNNLTADNVFVDYTQGAPTANFRLVSGAKPIDAGSPQPLEAGESYELDMDGTSRPQGAGWDVGSFEATDR